MFWTWATVNRIRLQLSSRMVVPRGRGLISKSVLWQKLSIFWAKFLKFNVFYMYFVLVWINLNRYITVYGRNLDQFWQSEMDSKHKGHLIHFDWFKPSSAQWAIDMPLDMPWHQLHIGFYCREAVYQYNIYICVYIYIYMYICIHTFSFMARRAFRMKFNPKYLRRIRWS